MSNFNPAKIEKTVISVRVPIHTLNEIDEMARDIDISRNEFIMQCIDFAIANYGRDKQY